MGSASETHRSASGIASRATSKPHRKIWGPTTRGMSWTDWNSLRAKALAASPSATPTTESRAATTSTQAGDPTVSTPRTRPTVRLSSLS
jgi:hypothetical protein